MKVRALRVLACVLLLFVLWCSTTGSALAYDPADIHSVGIFGADLVAAAIHLSSTFSVDMPFSGTPSSVIGWDSDGKSFILVDLRYTGALTFYTTVMVSSGTYPPIVPEDLFVSAVVIHSLPQENRPGETIEGYYHYGSDGLIDEYSYKANLVVGNDRHEMGAYLFKYSDGYQHATVRAIYDANGRVRREDTTLRNVEGGIDDYEERHSLYIIDSDKLRLERKEHTVRGLEPLSGVFSENTSFAGMGLPTDEMDRILTYTKTYQQYADNGTIVSDRVIEYFRSSVGAEGSYRDTYTGRTPDGDLDSYIQHTVRYSALLSAFSPIYKTYERRYSYNYFSDTHRDEEKYFDENGRVIESTKENARPTYKHLDYIKESTPEEGGERGSKVEIFIDNENTQLLKSYENITEYNPLSAPGAAPTRARVYRHNIINTVDVSGAVVNSTDIVEETLYNEYGQKIGFITDANYADRNTRYQESYVYAAGTDIITESHKIVEKYHANGVLSYYHRDDSIFDARGNLISRYYLTQAFDQNGAENYRNESSPQPAPPQPPPVVCASAATEREVGDRIDTLQQHSQQRTASLDPRLVRDNGYEPLQ